MTRTVTVTSGKGGVGKTCTAINLALGLASEGKSVLLFDADLSLANIDVCLGLTPKYTIADLLQGGRTLDEITVPGPMGISVIPAASGVESLSGLSATERIALLSAVESSEFSYDYLIIDTAAGIGSSVTFFASAACDIVCVVTPEPTALTDAYALIKLLSQQYGEEEIKILVNMADSEDQGKQVYRRLLRSVSRFLTCQLEYLGTIPRDVWMTDAVTHQQPLLLRSPSSPAARAYEKVVRRLDGDFWNKRVKGGMQFFFRALLEEDRCGA